MSVFWWIVIALVILVVTFFICCFNLIANIFAILSGIATLVLVILFDNPTVASESQRLITLGILILTLVFSFGNFNLESFEGQTESWYSFSNGILREEGGDSYEYIGFFVVLGVAAVLAAIAWFTTPWVAGVIAIIAIIVNIFRLIAGIADC